MKNIFLEFHARAITKILISSFSSESSKILDQDPPIPVLNQIDDNACVCISFAVTLWLVTKGEIWLNPKEIFTGVWNSSNGMSFVEAFLYTIDLRPDIFENWSIRRLDINIDNMKNCIRKGYPIMIGYQVPEEVARFHESGQEVMPTIPYKPSTTEGHAVCLIGFEECTFICVNSWGTIYGKSGKYKFPTENIHLITDAYTITPRVFNAFTPTK